MGKIKYRPNYQSLYAGIVISTDIMQELRRSDRKMEYMERDIKIERTKKNDNEFNPHVLPAHEDSYERLLALNQEFSDGEPTPEQQYIEKADVESLHRCLERLDKEEMELIKYLFYDGMTERETAKVMGISNVVVHKRKHRILAKLKKMLKI